MSTDIIAPPPLAAQQERLFAALAALRDPQARFAWAVERAKRHPPLPDALRREEHRVTGCQVRLWFVPELRDGRCRFRADSDAVTLKAMVGLLCELHDGATPAEIVATAPAPLDRLGLLRQLAENRRATVLRVAEQLRAFAAAHAGNHIETV